MAPQTVNSHLRQEATSLPILDLLTKPITVLQGVSHSAANALKLLEINTVFGLAASSVFSTAVRIVAAAQAYSEFGVVGRVPADLIDNKALAYPIRELQDKNIVILQSIGPKIAKELEEALAVTTIRDWRALPAKTPHTPP